MWNYNTDTKEWTLSNVGEPTNTFNSLKQDLSKLRLYSDLLKGSTYIPMANPDDVYDILGRYTDRNWYIGSPYSVTTIPPQFANTISATNSSDYYTKYLGEYGLTLKNKFTPNKLIDDAFNNFVYVDVATTTFLDTLGQIVVGLTIDDVFLKEGHRVLVKDQITNVTLSNLVDPNTYFLGNYQIVQDLGLTIEYQYYDETNGIYIYHNNTLIRATDLDVYSGCIRYSAVVKLGTLNKDKEYHLSRLLDGYFPTASELDPIEFTVKNNWMLRNTIEYDDLFETNYYDVIKHNTQSYMIDGVTYSIPVRTISVGEFGVFINNQEGVSNIIPNKYKVNLRSISQTSMFYWVCGDNGTILSFLKHNFTLAQIDAIDSLNNKITTRFNSISFFNDLRGVIVGDINTILVTSDGGQNWNMLNFPDFDGYTYNKVIYSSIDKFYVGGDTGVFIEFTFSNGQWRAYKRRVSKWLDSSDEYLLVENINDLYEITNTPLGLSYSYSTQSVISNDILLIVANNGNIIAYDTDHVVSGFDFLYFDFGANYGDIRSITREGTGSFYFAANNIYSFDINNFKYITSTYSNVISGTFANLESSTYVNVLYDYNGIDLLACGNLGLLDYATYSVTSFNVLDPSFDDKLKSKMLFLDYDMGSKLNFFDSSQTYRTPNSLTFSNGTFATSSLSISSQSLETSWLDYTRDVIKTFEYYTTISTANQVLFSATFSRSRAFQLSFMSSDISTSYFDIVNLAPNIGDKSASRFIAGSSSITASTASSTWFLYKYLSIIKTNNANFHVSVGDVLNIASGIGNDVINANIIVNNIINISGYNYLYAYTEFNDGVIDSIKSYTGSFIITNLNRYRSQNDLVNNFSIHPIGVGYSLTQDSFGDMTLSTNFNNKTSYYNMQASVVAGGVTYSMLYTDAFLKFGYSPTYNILDYLTSINSNVFFGIKEYLALPIYNGLPVGSLTSSNIFIDNNFTTNTLYFGSDLQFEWESIFINTFVDITLYGTSTHTKTKLLVMDKYYDSHPIISGQTQSSDAYVIKFHKAAWDLSIDGFDTLTSMDISSRRSLQQISSDLQELNNIQRPIGSPRTIEFGYTYENYESELNFKFPTDSYAKALLSDAETIQELSAMVYVDYKNELSLNITKLGREYETPILNTLNFGGILYISCSQKHGLSTGNGVSLEFTGGTGSSQQLNQQYFGYHVVTVFNNYDFTVDLPYGVTPLVGNDIGVVRYLKVDPFLDYTPIDIINIGADLAAEIPVILRPENIQLIGTTFSLINVNYNEFRFRLIDGMNINLITSKYSWLLEADIEKAIIGMDANQSMIWYNGIWHGGRWFGGNWKSGTWESGDWYDGVWESRKITDKLLTVAVDNIVNNNIHSNWYDGRWFGGTWSGGTWDNGRWYGGDWSTGIWYNGIWNDGIWNDGQFTGGVWVQGTWYDGVFNTNNTPAYWIDGKWYGGDFENGMWYSGVFDERNGNISRFGTNAFNSRTATWHNGTWVSGEFHSMLNLDSNGLPDVSLTHKFSIWNTGIWSSGDWYGGIAYDIDFRSGVWHGGILDDIEIIGVDIINNTFTLNGIFKYNIGNILNIIDNQIGNTYSQYGSNSLPGSYTILNIVEDDVNKWTVVYVDAILSGPSAVAPINIGLRVVSKFSGSNWKSGIWTNGLFNNNGLWEGGIWYNGVFDASSTWS